MSQAIDLSVRQVRAGVILAETLSYTRTAELLGYTEPAIHHQVRRLHEELGCVLFEKHGRGLRLTPNGSRLLPYMLSILTAADNLKVAADGQSRQRRLTVAAGLVTGAYTLPVLIAGFARLYPEVLVDLQLGTADEVARSVERGQAAVGVAGRLAQVPLSSTVRLRHWIDEEFGLYRASAQGPDLPRSPERAVIYTISGKSEGLKRLLREIDGMGVSHPDLRFVGSAEAAKNLCLAGEGFAFLRGVSAEPEASLGSLVRMSGGIPEIREALWICHQDEGLLEPEASNFVQFLLSAARRRAATAAATETSPMSEGAPADEVALRAAPPPLSSGRFT